MEQMPRSFRQTGAECVDSHGAFSARPLRAADSHDSGRVKYSPELIADLLDRHQGNRNAVAHELGVDRTTLWRWMSRSGLLTSAVR